jgi:hypothetical protein
MNSKNVCFVAIVALTAVLTMVSKTYATVQLSDNSSISGFGSTSIAMSNNTAALYVYREITDETCYDCDTVFGLQGDISFTDALNLSVQVVKRPQDDWSSPELEWAYLGYDFADYNIKAGRLRLPLFLDAEYYYVGQAYVSARPSQEVYSTILDLTSYDGISATWYHEISDELLFSLSPYIGLPGKNSIVLDSYDYELEIKKIAGIKTEISSYNYRLMMSYVHTKYAIGIHTPYGSIHYPTHILNIYTLGAEYSHAEWTITGEVVMDDIHFNWYSNLAYNYNSLTPYITYAESHHNLKNKSILAGVRFDLTNTVSLNAEWQYTDAKSGNTGQFVMQPSPEDTDAQLFTLMLNFIF